MKPLDAALRYAEHDRVPVFPCREREPGRKRPYTGQGFYDASRDPLLIKETRDLVEYRDPLALASPRDRPETGCRRGGNGTYRAPAPLPREVDVHPDDDHVRPELIDARSSCARCVPGSTMADGATEAASWSQGSAKTGATQRQGIVEECGGCRYPRRARKPRLTRDRRNARARGIAIRNGQRHGQRISLAHTRMVGLSIAHQRPVSFGWAQTAPRPSALITSREALSALRMGVADHLSSTISGPLPKLKSIAPAWIQTGASPTHKVLAGSANLKER
jgi:hypothetical protein